MRIDNDATIRSHQTADIITAVDVPFRAALDDCACAVSHQSTDEIASAGDTAANRTVEDRALIGPGQGAHRFAAGNAHTLQSHILYDARRPPFAGVPDANSAKQTDGVSGHGRDRQIANHVTASIERPGEGNARRFQPVRIQQVRGDQGRVERTPAGQIGVQVDVRDQHEALFQETRICLDGQELFGRGDSVGITRFSRPSGKGLGLDDPSQHVQTCKHTREQARTCLDRSSHGLYLRRAIDMDFSRVRRLCSESNHPLYRGQSRRHSNQSRQFQVDNSHMRMHCVQDDKTRANQSKSVSRR